MTTTLRLQPGEFNPAIFQKLIELFGDKEIEIIVHELDETDYLLSSESNRQHLMESARELDGGGGVRLESGLFE